MGGGGPAAGYQSSSPLGLTWAAVTVAEASPSLSDSSLLLAESSSCLLARVAGGPFFPGGAVADPFLGNPLVGAEAALIWGIFPEGFAWSKRNGIRGGS